MPITVGKNQLNGANGYFGSYPRDKNLLEGPRRRHPRRLPATGNCLHARIRCRSLTRLLQPRRRLGGLLGAPPRRHPHHPRVGIFCYDVLKKRFVRRDATAPAEDGTVISRRIFGESEEAGAEISDD